MIDLVYIPSGEFLMGSPETEEGRFDDEGPQHRVTVPAFKMGRYQVTQEEWRKAALLLPQVNRKLNPDPSYFKGDRRPVERVSWHEAVEFCDRLSQHTGYKYRLPTEAEWEYACRAGTTTAFYCGDTLVESVANFYDNETSDVGLHISNSFGLHDMHGNVLEWCADHWYKNYEWAPNDGSAWLSYGKYNNYVVRGGSWLLNPVFVRSACRGCVDPGYRFGNLGFRVVCDNN